MRETEPVGARGGPSTPPSGRDDEVTLVSAVLVEPGLLKLRLERVTAEDAPASGSFNRNFARETLVNLTVEEGGAGLDAGVGLEPLLPRDRGTRACRLALGTKRLALRGNLEHIRVRLDGDDRRDRRRALHRVGVRDESGGERTSRRQTMQRTTRSLSHARRATRRGRHLLHVDEHDVAGRGGPGGWLRRHLFAGEETRRADRRSCGDGSGPDATGECSGGGEGEKAGGAPSMRLAGAGSDGVPNVV
eukprot:scaffold2715_cov99-Isochrysis_galbana.AAC.1